MTCKLCEDWGGGEFNYEGYATSWEFVEGICTGFSVFLEGVNYWFDDLTTWNYLGYGFPIVSRGDGKNFFLNMLVSSYLSMLCLDTVAVIYATSFGLF